MTKYLLALFAISSLVFACGGGTPAPATPDAPKVDAPAAPSGEVPATPEAPKTDAPKAPDAK
jgi:hypothetical protein